MIAIKDIEMPSCCMNCRLLGREEMYCSIYPRRDLDVITVATNRPNWCPLVEVEERKVGKWIAIDDTHSQCMECGAIFCISSSNEWEINYCPNCGSKNER